MCLLALRGAAQNRPQCGGAAGNVKVISNCEISWVPARLPESEMWLSHMSQEQSVSQSRTSLTQPPPAPRPLMSIDLFLLLCLLSQRRRSTTWRASWKSMESRCPPSARLAGSWPMSSLWMKLHVRGAQMSWAEGGIWWLHIVYFSWFMLLYMKRIQISSTLWRSGNQLFLRTDTSTSCCCCLQVCLFFSELTESLQQRQLY